MKQNRGKMILCTALACLCMTSLLPTFSEAASNTAANATQDKVVKAQHHIMKKKINGVTYPDRNPNTKQKNNGVTYPDKAPKTKQKINGVTYPNKANKTKQKSNATTYPNYRPIDNMEFEIYDELDAEDYLYDMLSSMKGFNFKKNKIMIEEIEDFPVASNDLEWYFGYGARTKGKFYPERFFAVTEHGEIFEYDDVEDAWFSLVVPY